MSTIVVGIEKSPVCRVCLKFDSAKLIEFINLFDKYNGKFMNEKINYIVNIDIKQGDGLPNTICSSCVQSLETAYSFKRTCEESDIILQSALRRREVSDEKYEEIDVKGDFVNIEDYFDSDAKSPVELETDDVKIKYEFTKLDEKHDHETDSELADEGTEQSNTPSKAIDLPLECHDCGGLFKSKCKLRVHWKKEHMPSQLICPNCKKTFKTYKSLHSHIKKQVRHCLYASMMRIEGVGKSRIFYCKQCDYSAKKPDYVITHQVHHSGERKYACELCGKAYTQLSGLIVHKEQTHKTKIIEMTCDLCGKHVVGRANVYRHKKSHTSPKQFPCEICKNILKSKTTLVDHMKRHSNVKDESCDICHKTFKTRIDVYNHKQIVHIRSKLYTCDRCSYESRSCSSMTIHKKRHTATNVPCEICGTFVENVQQLKMHMSRHDKKIQCMYCDSKVLTQKNLMVHLRNKHGIRQGNKKIKKNDPDASDS